MVLENQKWNRVLELLFEYPNQEFTVRDISKRTKIPVTTVQRYLGKMKKEGFLSDKNNLVSTNYLKSYKAFFIINKLYKVGLIDYLEKSFNPSTLVVFGSIRKGEYDHESDIDLFIESTKNIKIDLLEFEKKLNHKIQLFVKKDINELPGNLKNNIINGIKLTGYLKIK